MIKQFFLNLLERFFAFVKIGKMEDLLTYSDNEEIHYCSDKILKENIKQNDSIDANLISTVDQQRDWYTTLSCQEKGEQEIDEDVDKIQEDENIRLVEKSENVIARSEMQYYIEKGKTNNTELVRDFGLDNQKEDSFPALECELSLENIENIDGNDCEIMENIIDILANLDFSKQEITEFKMKMFENSWLWKDIYIFLSYV